MDPISQGEKLGIKFVMQGLVEQCLCREAGSKSGNESSRIYVPKSLDSKPDQSQYDLLIFLLPSREKKFHTPEFPGVW